MSNVSRFERINAPSTPVEVDVFGHIVMLEEGANLAAELLNANVTAFRKTPVSGDPRGPFCMMGACFDCLVEIEGVTQQACMLQVRNGMVIKQAHGKSDA